MKLKTLFALSLFVFTTQTIFAQDDLMNILNENAPKKKRRMGWAELLARVFAIDMKSCPKCSGELKIVAAIVEVTAIRKILGHLGLPDKPPDISPARLSPQISFI